MITTARLPENPENVTNTVKHMSPELHWPAHRPLYHAYSTISLNSSDSIHLNATIFHCNTGDLNYAQGLFLLRDLVTVTVFKKDDVFKSTEPFLFPILNFGV